MFVSYLRGLLDGLSSDDRICAAMGNMSRELLLVLNKSVDYGVMEMLRKSVAFHHD